MAPFDKEVRWVNLKEFVNNIYTIWLRKYRAVTKIDVPLTTK
jgi:hypothetical protein